MQTDPATDKPRGEFLIQKSIFLLTSSVGRSAAETLINGAIAQIGVKPSALGPSDIAQLAAKIEPSLRQLVGKDKAQKLASALRVLVGGVV